MKSISKFNIMFETILSLVLAYDTFQTKSLSRSKRPFLHYSFAQYPAVTIRKDSASDIDGFFSTGMCARTSVLVLQLTADRTLPSEVRTERRYVLAAASKISSENPATCHLNEYKETARLCKNHYPSVTFPHLYLVFYPLVLSLALFSSFFSVHNSYSERLLYSQFILSLPISSRLSVLPVSFFA